MAEGDTILRAAHRIGAALAGEELAVVAPNPRGRAAGVERLDGRVLEEVEARGKNLLLHFGELTLHSHLGMNGAWQVGRRGAASRRPVSSAWVVLRGEEREAVQFGGPTLRVLSSAQLHRDPLLARLGPDILAPAFDVETAVRSLRSEPELGLGDALLDQRLLAGVGNIFKSEACFAARVDPWRPLAESTDADLRRVLSCARRLMQESVAGARAERAVHGRAGQPCTDCGAAILARGQGDANRVTYWCPRCQAV